MVILICVSEAFPGGLGFLCQQTRYPTSTGFYFRPTCKVHRRDSIFNMLQPVLIDEESGLFQCGICGHEFRGIWHPPFSVEGEDFGGYWNGSCPMCPTLRKETEEWAEINERMRQELMNEKGFGVETITVEEFKSIYASEGAPSAIRAVLAGNQFAPDSAPVRDCPEQLLLPFPG